MITSVRYDPLKWDFITFNINIISIRKCIDDMDVDNDVTCLLQNVIMHDHTIFMTQCYPHMIIVFSNA